MQSGVVGGLAAVARRAWACLWWSVRAHVADLHGLPRAEALEPPPVPWLYPATPAAARRQSNSSAGSRQKSGHLSRVRQ